jgi:hypothetical protein
MMAIYHCHLQIINRASGRSSIAAAAYRSGEKLRNERDGLTHDFTKKSGIVHTEILLPENAPAGFASREKLWNAVEKSEKRKDAQTAREIEVSLPKELNHAQQIELVRAYIAQNFTNAGMIADFALHDKQDGNPHAHIMLTLREVGESGFGKKQRVWNERQNAELWRESWAKVFNQTLEKNGVGERVDHRSYYRQGLEITPTVHLGSSANGQEKRGIRTDRGERNRQAQKNRQSYLDLLFWEREKTALLNEEKAQLGRLKNRYLEVALRLSEQKTAQDKADDYRHRARSIDDLSGFMNQTRERLIGIGQELQHASLDPARHLILTRQQAQLERSLQEDLALLFSQFALAPEQVSTHTQALLSQAAALESAFNQGQGLSFLEKLLGKLFELIRETFQSLREYLGPDFSLLRLGPYAGRENLSLEKQRDLQALEVRLEQNLSQALPGQQVPDSPAPEQVQGLSRER